MKNAEDEKYTVIITRMDGSKEEYAEISFDDVDFRERFLAINANNRIKYINIDTVKEFEVFK